MASVANRRSLMVLYSDSVSPIGHAVRIVLAEKDVNVEINYINEDDPRPEELNDLNPYNSILTLIDRDLVLYDAHIIMEYLDERFPHPPLMLVDPVNRGRNRQLRYRVMRDLYSAVEEIELVLLDNIFALVTLLSSSASESAFTSSILLSFPIFGSSLADFGSSFRFADSSCLTRVTNSLNSSNSPRI